MRIDYEATIKRQRKSMIDSIIKLVVLLVLTILVMAMIKVQEWAYAQVGIDISEAAGWMAALAALGYVLAGFWVILKRDRTVVYKCD